MAQGGYTEIDPINLGTIVIPDTLLNHGYSYYTFNTTACDTDGDGVPDQEDNCPELYNTSQYDSDGDGVGEACEILGCNDITSCNYDINATENDGSCTYPAFAYDCDGNCLVDTDEDNVCDEFDNCPYDYNPSQEIICDITSIKELDNAKLLITVIDILGRENNSQGFQLHIYDDGTITKSYLIE